MSKSPNIQAKFNKLYDSLLDIKRSDSGVKSTSKPMYITEYDIRQQSEASKQIEALRNRLMQTGVSVYIVNVFDVAIQVLEKRNALNEATKRESAMPKGQFLSALQSELAMQSILIPALKASIPEDTDFVFITGLSEVYPFIRAHDIINAIDSQYSSKWILFFYPGEYTGNSLNLFGSESAESNNHYRALKI